MKRKIKYSFIVPTFNSEKTIKNCLSSIKKQKLKNSEIIVVDDCSTDKTVKIAKKYAQKIIIKEKRSGPAKSRNLGWKIAEGDVCIFVDSDVYL
ncbi:MAG: glycosyltransferase family A protein [Candidatus Pacearchaeota archaeon]